MTDILRYKIEADERWREFGGASMPYIQFPSDWKVQMIAPFGGALVRFRVVLPSGRSKSIYFDAHDSLGCVGEPYWEVYPYRGDVGRCLMSEVDNLLQMIAHESGLAEEPE